MADRKIPTIIVNRENLDLLRTPEVQAEILRKRADHAIRLKKMMKDMTVNWNKEKDKRFSKNAA